MEKGIINKDEIENCWQYLDARVISLIASYIPNSLLHQMGFVCSRWNNILTPQIWSTIYTIFSRKSNNMNIFKKYGKFMKFIEEGSILDPLVGGDSWLEYCPQLYYYYLPRHNVFHSYSYEILSFKEIPKPLAPIPLMKISDKTDWMNIIMLSKMKILPIIEGYYVDSIHDTDTEMLTALPTEMKLKTKTLELDINSRLFISQVVNIINQFPNTKLLELYFYRDEPVDQWVNLDIFIKNSHNIKSIIFDFGITNIIKLYIMKFSNEEIGDYRTKISSLKLKLARCKSTKNELLRVPKNNRFNFFKFLIFSAPMLTYVQLPFVGYSILLLLSNNCPNLKKLLTKSPLPVFDNNIKAFKRLSHLSVSSLDEFHNSITDEFQTVFINVTQVYIDHWWAHVPNQCTHHKLFLLPQLFPKLVSLKLSHDISEVTLQKLLNQDKSLYISDLYLHSYSKPYKNLIQLIKKKCKNLHSVTYDWKREWGNINNAPIQDFIKEFPNLNIFIGDFRKAFKYKKIYTIQEFRKLVGE